MLVLFTQSSGRGQFSLETMVTYGFALLFLITITAYAFSQQNYVNDYNAFVEAQDAAEDVASLINLASGTDSFRQPYYAPAVVGGDNYSINVSSNQVFLVFGNRTYLA
ncbi:TPA: hypothetical protein HA318_05540, partial [Candidatus Micrarchaeota archaeon]|nr:hypothetical protein [Candidatus Micrarchaeota archaeon]